MRVKTCTVVARCYDRSGPISEKTWLGVDIMKIGHTTGWCTKQINKHRHDGVCVTWESVHDQPAEPGHDYRHRFSGRIVRIQGSLMRRGIFEN